MAVAVHPPLTTDAEDWRRPGCSTACREIDIIERGTWSLRPLVSHDPVAHEEFGFGARRLAEDDTACIVIGPLTLDHAAYRAYLHGDEVKLTVTEWRIVWYLASKVGRVCTQLELLTNIWGPTYAVATRSRHHPSNEVHVLRVNITRIRAKLGADRGLIETRTGLGYRLLAP